MEDYFCKPECFPFLPLSDHNTIILKSKPRISNQNTRKSVTFQDMKESNKASFGRYFSKIDWTCLSSQNTCEEISKRTFQWSNCNCIIPKKTIKVFPQVRAVDVRKVEGVNTQTRTAFHTDRNSLLYKFYRNSVSGGMKWRSGAKKKNSKVFDLSSTFLTIMICPTQ